jgi:IS5 family transposase
MGGKQLGFSDYEQTTAKKRAKKEKFLAMDHGAITPRKVLVIQGLSRETLEKPGRLSENRGINQVQYWGDGR